MVGDEAYSKQAWIKPAFLLHMLWLFPVYNEEVDFHDIKSSNNLHIESKKKATPPKKNPNKTEN